MKHMRAVLLLCSICLWSVFSYPAAIIFDLDGVLVEKNGFSAAWNIGLRHFLGFYNPYKVRQKMFEFFNTLEDRKPETPWAYNENLLLPQLLCDWLMGSKTCNEIRTTVQQALKTNKYTFSKKRYRKLTKKIADFMFSPKRLAQSIQPIKQGVKLLKQCKQKNHQIYILSNWDPESFEQLCNQAWFKEILDLCDGCIISGIVHMMKPDPCIFEHLFTTYKIDPDTTPTVYIDDTRENILSARILKKRQLYCFECKNKKFDPIKQELLKLKIL